MIKKVLLCLAILIACTQFNSCGKETDGIPPAIQKLIDDDVRFTQGCDDCGELYQVDDKVIPQMLQMATESGPDIGARPVSVLRQ